MGGHGNAHLLDKLDLGIEHTLVIIIQAQDESSLNLHPFPLDFANGIEEKILFPLAHILRFLGLEQPLGWGVSMPRKTVSKPASIMASINSFIRASSHSLRWTM